MRYKKYKILNTIGSGYSIKAKEVLDKLGKVDYKIPSQKELRLLAGRYDIFVVGLGLNIDKKIIDKAKNLKIIATATTGSDHIDVDYAERKGIKILSLRGEEKFLNSITGTAELAFGLMIALMRFIPSGSDAVKKYKWEREEFRGRSLTGKTFGIVGLGRLGKMMAGYGNAFGMKIIFADPNVSVRKIKKFKCEKVSFDKLLRKSDVISVHIHLNKETKNIFNLGTFRKMKETAYLINTSRGKIVNEKDLLNALQKRKIAGYAADVLADELNFNKNFKHNPLVEYASKNRNLIITPHIGGMTYEFREATDIFIAEKLRKYLRSSSKTFT